MIPTLDNYRSGNVLVIRHGEDAPIEPTKFGVFRV